MQKRCPRSARPSRQHSSFLPDTQNKHYQEYGRKNKTRPGRSLWNCLVGLWWRPPANQWMLCDKRHFSDTCNVVRNSVDRQQLLVTKKPNLCTRCLTQKCDRSCSEPKFSYCIISGSMDVFCLDNTTFSLTIKDGKYILTTTEILKLHFSPETIGYNSYKNPLRLGI